MALTRGDKDALNGRILRWLESAGPSTLQQLGNNCRVDRTTLGIRITELRKLKKVHIGSWEKRHIWTRVIHLGAGEDVDLDTMLDAQVEREVKVRVKWVPVKGGPRTRFVKNINPWTGEKVKK